MDNKFKGGIAVFSQENRCLYRKNQLSEVICQLRFPEILTINANAPVDFQEAIRSEYPQYSAKQELVIPKLPGNVPVPRQEPVRNYLFASADSQWRINLTSKFISLTCTNYTCWEDFAKKLDNPLAAFIKIYKPAYFERIGLRYLNFISRSALSLQEQPFRALIAPCYLGPLGETDIHETQTNRCSTDCDLVLKNGCRAKIHAGPGTVKINGQSDPELKYIFDLDLYMPGSLPVNYSAAALEALHSQSYPIFRGAITDDLHDAMEPET